MISKEEIFKNSQGGYLLYAALIDGLKLKDNKSCKNCKNPLYDDSKPSLSIYLKGDKWHHNDYGDPSYRGDALKFVADFYNLDLKSDFPEVLERSEKLLSGDIKNIPLPQKANEPMNKEDREFLEPIISKDQSQRNAYFKQFGVSTEILDLYRVYAIDSYTTLNSQGYSSTIEPKDKLHIAFMAKGYCKIYCPEPKRFFYLGNKPKNYIFGERGLMGDNFVIITSGEKDVLTLAGLGYPAICLNSETCMEIPQSFLRSCRKERMHYLVLYDLDETGIKASERLVQKYSNFKRIELPSELIKKGGKDISDYVSLGLSLDDLNKKIMNQVELHDDYDKISESPKSLESENNTSLDKCLSSELIEYLPLKLRNACLFFDKKYERDVFLLSSLVVISAGLPNVYGTYD